MRIAACSSGAPSSLYQTDWADEEELSALERVVLELHPLRKAMLQDRIVALLEDPEVEEVARAALEGRWEHALSSPRLPDIGLTALETQRISETQFGTLMRFWGSCIESKKRGITGRFLRVNAEEGMTSEAMRRIWSSLHNCIDGEPEEGAPMFCNEEQFIPAFQAKITELPLSERVLLIFEEAYPQAREPGPQTLTQQLDDIGFHVLSLSRSAEGGSVRMEAALGLHELVLDILHDAQRLQRQVTIGSASSLTRMRYLLERGRRVVCVPFPKIHEQSVERATLEPAPPAPKTDGFITGSNTAFSRHEDYHVLISSSAPVEVRTALLQLSRDLEEMSPPSKERELLVDLLIDLELVVYQQFWKGTEEVGFPGAYSEQDLFWLSLARIFAYMEGAGSSQEVMERLINQAILLLVQRKMPLMSDTPKILKNIPHRWQRDMGGTKVLYQTMDLAWNRAQRAMLEKRISSTTERRT